MLNCKEVSRLMSQAMETRLSWPQRVGVRVHLLYCVWCRRYAAQIKFLRRAVKQLDGQALDPSAGQLSDQAKEQMRQRLAKALKSPPAPPR